MTRRAATAVRVTTAEGQQRVFAAGEELPEWAASLVTNPDAFTDDDESDTDADDVEDAGTDAGDTGEEDSDDSGEESDYASMKVAELRDLATERGLSTEGLKADLVAALEDDDRVHGEA